MGCLLIETNVSIRFDVNMTTMWKCWLRTTIEWGERQKECEEENREGKGEKERRRREIEETHCKII